MARKLVIAASTLGSVAVAAGVYRAVRRRKERADAVATARSRPVPVGATDNAHRFGTQWKTGDPVAQEYAGAATDPIATAAH